MDEFSEEMKVVLLCEELYLFRKNLVLVENLGLFLGFFFLFQYIFELLVMTFE